MGIESRSASGKTEIVFTFNNNITVAGTGTATCGEVGKITVDPADSHNVLVRLNELACNQAVVTVTLTGATDDQGHTLSSASVTFGILFGDVTADGSVDHADVAAVRAVQGQRTNSLNFRADINTDREIDTHDVREVKSYGGNGLPQNR
jgi:hypothetical protein